jgi:repressor LexA
MTSEGTFPIPRELLADDGTLFLMQAPDDTMAGLGICKGDWAIVREQNDAENDDYVVTMIEGAAAIRFLGTIHGDRVLFASSISEPVIPARDAVITGRVVAVLRQI